MKVLNFGSLNIDYVYQVDHFVEAGETLSSDSLALFCGGKGLNQSIALSRCGVEVWHAGAVGEKDSDILLEQLAQAGVHTNHILKKQGNTGHAIIQIDKTGQNCILLFGGTNQLITRQDVDNILSHFDKGDFILLQNEISQVDYIMEQAHKRGMIIVLNPSPMNDKIRTYPLALVDYFILNEIEAREIGQTQVDKEIMLKQLASLFSNAKIIITFGEEGSVYKESEITIYQSIYPVKVVDTTAAGDTFTGYFIGSIIKGDKVEQAMDYAAKASAIAVTKKGAGCSIPTRAEVMVF